MPQGLIDVIIDQLTDATDLLCLAFSCGYFLRLLANRVQNILKTADTPWAGDRLILIGDYA